MRGVWVVGSRGRRALHRHDPGPAFTVSFSVFPALNVGDVDADTETASPVLGLRPVRAGLSQLPTVESVPCLIMSKSFKAR